MPLRVLRKHNVVSKDGDLVSVSLRSLVADVHCVVQLKKTGLFMLII
jgi:hypothetical protein